MVVRRGDWKLIHLFESGENELYHTGRDIGETKNIVADSPKLAQELSERIERWLEEAKAPPMTQNPEYDANWKANR